MQPDFEEAQRRLAERSRAEILQAGRAQVSVAVTALVATEVHGLQRTVAQVQLSPRSAGPNLSRHDD